jgi:iron(III) transport system substrate-binding protein
MLAGETGAEDRRLAAKLQVVIPDPAHVNVSGAGVTRQSRHRQEAIQLIEFLASPTGGRGYAEANHEYPLRSSGEDPILKRFGPVVDDGVRAAQMGERNAEAVRLMQANGWR